MRKKLDTRFPAARIKKIMQTDEDVGKIALAVPVLVSKALELFLQDLCDRTYSITLDKGVKTLNSSHLKQCVHSFQVFDFLKDVVSKVPDLGSLDAGSDDRSAKRRKVADEDNESEEEMKKSSIETTVSSSSKGRGKGRGRGRGSRTSHGVDRDSLHYDTYEDNAVIIHHDDRLFEQNQDTEDDDLKTTEHTENIVHNTNNSTAVRNFDLNLDLDEYGDASLDTAPATILPTNSESNEHEIKHEEYPGWSLDKINDIAMDHVQFATAAHQPVDEVEEDYDVED